MPTDLLPLQVIRSYRPHAFDLHSFFASRLEARGPADLLVYEGRTYSYAETYRQILAAVVLLEGMKVKAGDRIAVFSNNHPSTAVLLFALAYLGAIMVPANPVYGAGELHYVLQHSGATGIIVSPDILAVAEEAIARLATQPWVMLNEPHGTGGYPVFGEAADRTARIAQPPPPRGQADSIGLIIYTSGTTGFPKGVMHAQRSVVLTGEGFVGRMRLQPSDRLMCVLPMFHINALLYSLCGAVACGGAVIPVRRFSAGGFWPLVKETGATEVNLVPAAANILIRRPRSEFVPGHGLAKAFVAPCTQEMVRALTEDFQVRDVIECYGMTEIPGVFAVPFEGPRKLASMGVVSPHPDPAIERPQARIVDAGGAPVPRGVSGELLVRTPTMLKGYFNAPEATAAAIEQGWFRTGDIVYQDADGFYFYVGRMKDLIRRRGENISGAELDQVIVAHPAVADAAVIGVPSELGEEEIMAVVVPRPGHTIDAWELRDWVRHRLSAIKSPRYVCVVDQLPCTPTQRVEKYKLRADKGLLQRAIDTEGAKP